jgi:hypothetical protein
MLISKALGLVGVIYIVSLLSLIYLVDGFNVELLFQALGLEYNIYHKAVSYFLLTILFILAAMPSLILFWMYEIGNNIKPAYSLDNQEEEEDAVTTQ